MSKGAAFGRRLDRGGAVTGLLLGSGAWLEVCGSEGFILERFILVSGFCLFLPLAGHGVGQLCSTRALLACCVCLGTTLPWTALSNSHETRTPLRLQFVGVCFCVQWQESD